MADLLTVRGYLQSQLMDIEDQLKALKDGYKYVVITKVFKYQERHVFNNGLAAIYLANHYNGDNGIATIYTNNKDIESMYSILVSISSEVNIEICSNPEAVKPYGGSRRRDIKLEGDMANQFNESQGEEEDEDDDLPY